MTEEKIARINELAHKAKTAEGLTPEEKVEQQKLRREFIDSIKNSVRSQLNNVDVEQEDGTIINLGEKYGNKQK